MLLVTNNWYTIICNVCSLHVYERITPTFSILKDHVPVECIYLYVQFRNVLRIHTTQIHAVIIAANWTQKIRRKMHCCRQQTWCRMRTAIKRITVNCLNASFCVMSVIIWSLRFLYVGSWWRNNDAVRPPQDVSLSYINGLRIHNSYKRLGTNSRTNHPDVSNYFG